MLPLGILLMSHSRAVLSSEAVRTRVPSGENAALLTASLCPFRTSGENLALLTESSCPFRTTICLPVTASHTRAVLSSEAVTTRVPSGENAALQTSPPCPFKTAIGLPVTASHSRAVLSWEAVRTRVLSGENAALVTEATWPRKTPLSRNCKTAALNAAIVAASGGVGSFALRGHAARASFVARGGSV